MRKPLYNIVIFIFHIITLILLFTLCIHFNVIKLDFLDFSKEAVASFFKNDYVVNIVCTILTVAALYIIQIKYSKVLIQLGHEIHRFLVDIDFMSKYWFSLLDYLGYDPMPIKLYIELFKKEYPDYENMSEFLKLPVAQQNKISRKVQKKASKIYLKYRIRNFFK